jgi:hypothetical protein
MTISTFKKMVLADLTLIKAFRQKDKFQFVRQTWLAPNFVFSIISRFFNKLDFLESCTYIELQYQHSEKTCILQKKVLDMFNSKVVSLILIIVFALPTIVGCKKLVDSFPPRYVLTLRFTDQEGKDLLEDVQEDIIRKDITFSSSDGEIMSPSVEILEFNGNKYLEINLSSRPNLNLKQISYVITSKNLMGDAEANKIITQWHLEKNNNTVKLLQWNEKIITPSNEPILHYELVSSN